MSVKRNRGKFEEPKKPNIKNRLERVLLVVFMMVLLAGMLILLFGNRKSQKMMEELSDMVHTTNPIVLETGAISSTAAVADKSMVEHPVTEPVETTQSVLTEYAELYEQNKDLAGWIQIEGTRVDYPVMHTPEEPERYLHKNFIGSYSFAGIPFIDAQCSMDSDNLLIYGHNMLDGTMFRDITKYERKNFWQQHPTITFNTLYEQQEYEVLAAFYDRVYLKTETAFKFYQFIDAENEEEFDAAIAQFKDKALYDTGVEASYGDQLITLVTCTEHTYNGRFVVVAKRR